MKNLGWIINKINNLNGSYGSFQDHMDHFQDTLPKLSKYVVVLY